MSRAVTLATLRGDLRFQADIQSMTARHPDVDLNRLLNESWQELRQKVSDVGYHTYLKPAQGALTPGPLAGFSFGSLALPADLVSIYGFDVTVSANDIRTLEPMSWGERNDYRDPYGTNRGIPVGFHIYNIGVEATTTITPGTVAIYPAPDRAYAYSLWYLPAWTSITNDTYVFDDFAGWSKWVLWNATINVCARDNDMQQCAAIATQERDRIWGTIQTAANNLQKAGPSKRVDVAARNRGNRMDHRRRYP